MSIGIVADEHLHPVREYNSIERASAWLARHEPDVAAFLAPAEVEDFYALKSFSYWSRQVFSAERWACVGDAGVFADPLYSPGSDFTALTNTLTTRLIADDAAGRLDAETVRVYNRLVLSDIGENTLELYRDNYASFGCTRVTVAKTHWDTCYYWALPAALFFNGHFEPRVLDRYSEVAQRFLVLNRRVQKLFRDWAERIGDDAPDAREYVAYSGMPFFRSLQAELLKPRGPDEMLAAMQTHLERFESWAIVLFRQAVAECLPGRSADVDGASVDPYRLSLDPSAWGAGQLFSPHPAAQSPHLEEMRAQARQFISAPCSWAG
jgi:hypothetical protein